MIELLRRRSRCFGSALFRGMIPHGLDQLDGLAGAGVSIEPGRRSDTAHWTVTLRHPEWGKAEAACLRNPPAPDRRLLELDPRLSPADVDELTTCGVSISVTVEGERGFVPRDRKTMLRFLHALLSADGVAAVDHTASAFWTRPALEDELAHDADLDVESLYILHAVTGDDDQTVSWLHSHGLAELGRFDFDILQPSREFVDHCGDFCRALAFSILEGHVQPGVGDWHIGNPFPPLNLVRASDFSGKAAPEHRALRDDPSEEHEDDRVVLCEPTSAGFLGRMLGRDRPRPARAFTRALPENVTLNFSNEATELMAERARRTYPVLREVAAEVAELELPVLVKLGYVIDGGGPDEREHLWFHVHDLDEETVDATLVNSPWNVARLKEGERGRHPVELLTEWTVLTPFGPITPRAFHARRMIRERRAEMLEMLRQSREA